MSSLEYINDVWPDHDRSSCSDDNLSNAGVKESGCCYCRRCQGLYELRQEQQIEALKAERDALAAQVKYTLSDVFSVSEALFESISVLEGELLPCLEDKEPLEELINKFRNVLGKSPKEHMQEMQSIYLREGFVAGVEWLKDLPAYSVAGLDAAVRQLIAAKVQQGGAK